MGRTRSIFLWLLLACAGIAGLSYSYYLTQTPLLSLPAETVDPNLDPQPPIALDLSLPPLADAIGEYVDIVRRPLFSDTRRLPPTPPPMPPPLPVVQPPPPSPPAEPEPEPEPPPAVQLIGTSQILGQIQAMLRFEGKSLRVREGDSVAGWRVAVIRDREVLLRQGAREHPVSLLRGSAAKVAPTAPPPRRRPPGRPIRQQP